jgi:hypothetical protein
MPNFFDANGFTKKPVIQVVGGNAFYLCAYTGLASTTRVGLPGHLVGKSATTVGTFGCFRNWNVLFRFLTSAVDAGDLAQAEFDSISSWFAETFGNDQMALAPDRSRLLAFGGDLADGDYDHLYEIYKPETLIEAATEWEERQKKPKTERVPKPTVQTTLREMQDPAAPTFFSVCTWAKSPNFFAVQRVGTNELAPSVTNWLDVERLPLGSVGSVLISGPDNNTKAAEKWLDENARPAKLAAKKAAQKLEAERKRRDQLAAKAQKRPAHMASTPAGKKVARKPKSKAVDMATFAQDAAAAVADMDL